MSFKAGDLVRCKVPVGELEKNKVYSITSVNIPKNTTANENNISLELESLKNPYYSFRFELVENNAEVTVIENSWFNTDVLPPPMPAGQVVHVTNCASKNDSDKADLSLIPFIALKEEAKAFTVGANKYGRLNYLKGHKASKLVAAAMRHLLAWNEGEENDPEDGQHHLGSVRACCAMILRQMEIGTLKDDRKA